MKNVPRWSPYYDVLRKSRERQFNSPYKIYYYNMLKYSFSVPSGSKSNWVYPMSHKFWRDVPRTSLLRPKVTSAWWRPCEVPRMSILRKVQKHYCCIIFNPTHQMCCVKYLKVSRFLFLKFSRKVPRTSSKCPEKTSLGWPPWDIPKTSILILSCKCILIALFSILFHQICAWNTKELAVL